MDIEPTGLIPAAKAAVTGAIRSAAQLTGASFEFLLATARVESRLNPQAAAPTSSARGPFQFIEQTWLATVKQEGPALGYGRLADAIERQPSGQYTVTDPKLYGPIMELRTDPKISAAMAGAFAKANAAKLTAWLGRTPTEGELYLAHFMGPSGAARLIGLAETQPHTAAADAYPLAAKANPTIFYDRQKKPRSVADVYRILVGRYDVARATPPVIPAAAIVPASAVIPAVNKVAPVAHRSAALARPVAPYPIVAPTRTLTRPVAALPVATPQPVAPELEQVAKPSPDTARIAAATVDNAMPVFHTLFHTVERPKPVAPVVAALWGTPPAAAAPAQQPVAAPAPATTTPVQPAPPQPATTRDLFQDQRPDVRALFRGGA